jgi:hypothetical protein
VRDALAAVIETYEDLGRSLPQNAVVVDTSSLVWFEMLVTTLRKSSRDEGQRVASKQQFTGMVGLYLVAAELSRRNFILSPTSRSAEAADLLVTDPMCKHTYAVQVKTNAQTFSFWLTGPSTSQIKSDTLIYAFVNL